MAPFTLVLYALGCLGCSYKGLAIGLPIVSTLVEHRYFDIIRLIVLMGLPFFTLGYYINIFEKKHPMVDNKKSLLWYATFLLLYILELALVLVLKLQENIAITLMLYPLVFVILVILLNNPLERLCGVARYCRVTANFMYYSHVLIITLLSVITKAVGVALQGEIIFLITVALTLSLGFIIYKLNNKYINKLVI